jgi:ABC-type transport system substrate-binding protein
MRARPELTKLVLVVALALGAACERRDRRTADDTLVYLLDSNLVELDTRWATSSQEIKVSRLVAPALVSVDQQSMEARLELAEAVTNVDPVTWDVTVRPGIRFPDGSPLTARDVAYTFNSTLDPKYRAAYLRHFRERLTGVEVLDERRARFHLRSRWRPSSPISTTASSRRRWRSPTTAAGPAGSPSAPARSR